MPTHTDSRHGIFTKITDGTVTIADFNLHIQEAIAKSAAERVRRRVRRTPTDSHIDADGHQPLGLPDLPGRTVPKRKPDAHAQMHHRGKSAQRHSTRTQDRQRYAEAVGFIVQNRGKCLAECDLEGIHDTPALRQLVTYMLSRTTDAAQRDWLYTVRCKLG